jgi:5-methyltetrahydrofolate--homocysteine methyltransferase
MSALRELLSRGRAVVADGAWGTQLVKRGLGRQTPEAWNLEQPEQVAAVAADYAAAGAQIVITNTFGGTSTKLEKAGLAAGHDAINRAGVELSRQGAAGRALVVPSMGPTGELLGFTSKLSEAQVEEVFRQQALALLAGQPDGLLIETMADLAEALCALRGAKAACDLPVIVSMTYDEGARGPASMMGVTPDRAAAELTAAGADLIGANCGRLSEEAWEQVVGLTAANTGRPIWVKANAGIPQLVDGASVFPMQPDQFADLGKRLVAAGATVVGGCCGTTPEHIAALARALE